MGEVLCDDMDDWLTLVFDSGRPYRNRAVPSLVPIIREWNSTPITSSERIATRRRRGYTCATLKCSDPFQILSGRRK